MTTFGCGCLNAAPLRLSKVRSDLKSILLAPTLFLVLLACASPHTRITRICSDCELIELNRDSAIPLTAYYRPPADGKHDVLHIYLEGDGVPWQFNRPARNPVSRRMTALRLMQMDKAASLYLNRPCYGQSEPPPACRPDDWTFGRYSDDVVSKMNRALDEFSETGHLPLVLIGYSGGGTLAMLLAARRTDVIGVITIAANLDHQSWTGRHGYLPLHNSLNASKIAPLPAHIFRWHLAGGKDIQVPADLVYATASTDRDARYLYYPDFDHTCCWSDIWPELLRSLPQLRASTGTK